MLFHHDSITGRHDVFSLLMLCHFGRLLVLRLPLLRAFLALILVLGHDVLKVTPQRLDGRELSADLRDLLERAVQLVDVLEYELETLQDRSVAGSNACTAVCSGVSEEVRGGGFYLRNVAHEQLALLLKVRLLRRRLRAIRGRGAVRRHGCLLWAIVWTQERAACPRWGPARTGHALSRRP